MSFSAAGGQFGRSAGGEVVVRVVLDPSDLQKLGGTLGNGVAGGSGSGPGPGGGTDAGARPVKTDIQNVSPSFMSIFKPLAALTLIEKGIGGMLQHSQVANSYLGAMGKVFGSAIDILLIPFTPILNTLLLFMVQMLPMMVKISEFLSILIGKYNEGREAVGGAIGKIPVVGGPLEKAFNFVSDPATLLVGAILGRGLIGKAVGSIFKGGATAAAGGAAAGASSAAASGIWGSIGAGASRLAMGSFGTVGGALAGIGIGRLAADKIIGDDPDMTTVPYTLGLLRYNKKEGPFGVKKLGGLFGFGGGDDDKFTGYTSPEIPGFNALENQKAIFRSAMSGGSREEQIGAVLGLGGSAGSYNSNNVINITVNEAKDAQASADAIQNRLSDIFRIQGRQSYVRSR